MSDLATTLEDALPERSLNHDEIERITARLQARSVSTITQYDPEQEEDRVTCFAMLTREHRLALWIDLGADGWSVDPLAVGISERDFASAIETAQEDVYGDAVELEGSTKRIRGAGRHAELEDVDADLFGGDRDE